MTPSPEGLHLSGFFAVRQTNYGGRACFAQRNISRGTIILESKEPVGCTVCYDFRKEVCHRCFHYEGGNTMKFKLSAEDLQAFVIKIYPSGKEMETLLKKGSFLGAGLWFCSDLCRRDFLTLRDVSVLLISFEKLLRLFQSQNKARAAQKSEETGADPIAADINKHIEQRWSQIETEWIPRLSKLKDTRQQMEAPILTEEEYISVRFVIDTLWRIRADNLKKELCTRNQAFECLQSNEISKIRRAPSLLMSQIKIFQTLYIILPFELKSFLTSTLFRHIIGADYANSFGIWELGLQSDARELLGYWMIPEASFFNHSCAPNVDKRRIGNTLHFVTNKDINANEQLCIDYSGILDLDVKERQKSFSENWFFNCTCDRCSLELKAV
ncbi:LAMI_0F03950g1_1 [Lachancea mirantina]|uniref:LAMI_0F03950g1_1 n=1 Tax=Lachancea mirantina TaxID=1230905 RepID=A0A1G4JXI8_9SACH|nr:LAMI_0F03950g1_1 [Lachancea mirantina]